MGGRREFDEIGSEDESGRSAGRKQGTTESGEMVIVAGNEGERTADSLGYF